MPPMVSRSLVVSIILALAGGTLLTAYAPSLGLSGRVTNGCARPPGYTLLVADENGYNDSAHHSRPWPVIQVQRGETVKIVVCNLDPVSPHGFEINNYVGPVQLTASQSFPTTFVADRPGNYSMYCTIFCPVHQYMLYGLLVVRA